MSEKEGQNESTAGRALSLHTAVQASILSTTHMVPQRPTKNGL